MIDNIIFPSGNTLYGLIATILIEAIIIGTIFYLKSRSNKTQEE